MGSNSGWFRRLFYGKKSKNSPTVESPRSDAKPVKNKKKWGILGSRSANEIKDAPALKEVDGPGEAPLGSQLDASHHAITVAAAAAAVAEAAVAAAKAAAEVVRLTNSGRCATTADISSTGAWRLDTAAVTIQSAFRGYLARRALRALKALVKLQALVRGHIVRKRSANMLRRMQALARVQARASASRARTMLELCHSGRKSSLSHHMRFSSNPNISDIFIRERAQPDSSWLNQWDDKNSCDHSGGFSAESGDDDDERGDKILQVDNWRPDVNSKGRKRTDRRNSPQLLSSDYATQSFRTFSSPTKYSTKPQKPGSCHSMGRAFSLSSLQFPSEVDEAANSPHAFPVSTRLGSSGRRVSMTPPRSDCSPNFHVNHPKYMDNTESSLAKVRSQSAPKQRLDFEKPGLSKRYFRGFWDASSSIHKSLGNKDRPG